MPLPPSATGHYKIRLKVKSLPPPPPPVTTVENFTKTYQCKYCSYTTPWLKDISRHEKQRHRTYSSYAQEDIIHNNNDLSALFIDNVQSYNESIPNQNEEMILIEDDDDDDDAYEKLFFFI